MRVLELYGGGGTGGASQYLRTLLPALRERGVDVSLWSLPPHAVAVDVPTRRFIGVREAAKALRHEHGALVHAHGLKAHITTLLARPRCTVRTVHSFMRDDYTNPLRREFAALVDRLTLPRVAAVIVPSEALAKDMCARAVSAARVHVVRHGIAPERMPAPREDLLALADLPPEARVALVAARLEHVKGVDLAVRTLAQLQACWHLIVFGEGSQRETLQALGRSLGCEARLHLLGYRRDARLFFGAADAVVVPSRQESIGLTAVEAMAAGARLVVTDVGGLPETVGDAAVIVPSEDPAALAAAVERAPGDTSIGERARRRYVELFSLQRFVDETVEVLERAHQHCLG